VFKLINFCACANSYLILRFLRYCRFAFRFFAITSAVNPIAIFAQFRTISIVIVTAVAVRLNVVLLAFACIIAILLASATLCAFRIVGVASKMSTTCAITGLHARFGFRFFSALTFAVITATKCARSRTIATIFFIAVETRLIVMLAAFTRKRTA